MQTGYARLIGLVLTPAFAVSGCVDFTTFNRVRTVNPGVSQQAFIDAKQRVVITVPGTTRLNGQDSAVIRTCAEPSPDALSALAASGSGGLSAKDQVSLQAAFAFSETASSIGLRTQSIQLMRDAMYRLCEGMASGALSSAQFETLHRRFQNSMVAILAIEQLTGTVRPGAAQLSTVSAIGSAKEIAALTESTAKARQTSTDADAMATVNASALDKAKSAAAAYLTANGGTADALDDTKKAEYAKLTGTVTTATAAKANADSVAAAAKEKLATYETGMKAIGGGNLAASGTAIVSGGSGGALTPEAASAVATAVAGIVSEELDMGFFREACATLFVAQIEGRVAVAGSGDLTENCRAYAVATIDQMKVSNELERAYAANIKMLTEQKIAVVDFDDNTVRPPDAMATEQNIKSKTLRKPSVSRRSKSGPRPAILQSRRRPPPPAIPQ